MCCETGIFAAKWVSWMAEFGDGNGFFVQEFKFSIMHHKNEYYEIMFLNNG